jgi:2'-5' RNA ligase
MMIAVVPPASLVEDLVLEEGESAEQLHITLAYLGQTSEYSEDMVNQLPELIEAWAEGQATIEATAQGAGTFVKSEEDGTHVLLCLIDAPGITRMHVGIIDYLKGHGFDPRENHSFTPHLTLAYGKHHFRFMPKVERQTWKVHEVWVCIGGRWESFPLRG